MPSFDIRSLDAALDTATFSCGHAALDTYIQRYASQDVRRNVARVFVATPCDQPSVVAGFFSLNAGSVNCTDLPAAMAKKLPSYPVPVALIGRLAVAIPFKGKGLGSVLLADACKKVVQASSVLAMVGIIVDAKDDAAAAFYSHFGFAELPGNAHRLLLPMKMIESLI